MTILRSAVPVSLVWVALLATSASADHERFIVGEMRDVNPSPKDRYLYFWNLCAQP